MARQKSAEYWLGYQSYELHKQCDFTEESARWDWARGFADAVGEIRRGKVWYKSRTLVAGLCLLLAGIGAILHGHYGGGGHALTGCGAGVSAMSLIMVGLRLVTEQSISWEH